MTDVSDFLASSAGDLHPGFKFESVGDTIKGTICEPPRVVETNNLSSGQPEKKLVLAVQTESGDIWSVWVRRGFMAKAVNEAIEAAGATGLAEGGTIAVKFAEERDTGKPSKAKVFVAKYTPPPAPTVSVDDF